MCDPFVSTALVRCRRIAADAAGVYASAGAVLVRGTNFRKIGFSGLKSPCELSLRGICNNKRKIMLGDRQIKEVEIKRKKLGRGLDITLTVVPESAKLLVLAPMVRN